MKVVIDGMEYTPVWRAQVGDAPPIHKLFARAREASHDTLKTVSAATGLCSSTICGAESGNAVTLLTAIKLCRYYGIDLETLADSVDTHGIPNAAPRTPSKRKATRVGRRA